MNAYSNLVSLTLSGTYDDDRPVVIDATDPNRFVTRARATDLIARLAGAFREGSTVCLHLHNDILYPILILAILASNCRWTGSLPVYTCSEVEHHLRTGQVDYVITSTDLEETVSLAVQSSGRRTEIILWNDILESDSSCDSFEQERNPDKIGKRKLRDLLRNRNQGDLEILLRAIRPDGIAALMQTSGTTGMPKMATRSHRSLMMELSAIEDNLADKPYPVRRFFCTPLQHAFCFPEAIFNSLRLGLTTVIGKRFDDTFAEIVEKHSITEIFVAPPILLRLANQPHLHPLLQSVHAIFFAGCPLTHALRLRTLAMFSKPPRIVPVYGMTEGGWFAMFRYPEEDETGSAGRVIPGYELKVCATDTMVLDDGSCVGELLAFGPQLTGGYLDNKSATENAFTSDGWLRTGDIGYINDGKIYLIDRAKDIMKVNGFQVAPAELENALALSEDVQDAAVFGVGTDVDEHPLACVLRRNQDVTEASIIEHLRATLAGYKVSKCEIRFVDSIPKSPAGKILKNALKAQLAQA
ncbi:MAG: hypothetical protein TREMPRED_003539 [Tremellales sp. Tagirdzhanova-0007]|nr:MAG: hypothetical protein TREMPRED_003539 [Tremellales sp. Tagirdzhanova-0007]